MAKWRVLQKIAFFLSGHVRLLHLLQMPGANPGGPGCFFLHADPAWDPLRGDPRFRVTEAFPPPK